MKEFLGILVYNGIRTSVTGTEGEVKHCNKNYPNTFTKEISVVLGDWCKEFEKEAI